MNRVLKNLGAFAVGFWLVIVPFEVFSDVQVTDAGTTAANGCYSAVGVEWYLDGIVDAGNYRMDSSAGTRCRIGIPNAGNPQSYYREVGGACTSANAAAGAWLNDAGANPSPTLTDVTCGGGPGPDTTTSTSTVSQSQQNLFNGFLIFFITMFGIMWMFKKRI